jgi:hypothetical protein
MQLPPELTIKALVLIYALQNFVIRRQRMAGSTYCFSILILTIWVYYKNRKPLIEIS